MRHQKFLLEFGILFNMVVNLMTVLELYLIISYPFYNRNDRKKWYYLLCFILFLGVYLLYIVIDPPDQGPENPYPRPNELFEKILRGLYSFLISSIFLFSFLVVWK